MVITKLLISRELVEGNKCDSAAYVVPAGMGHSSCSMWCNSKHFIQVTQFNNMYVNFGPSENIKAEIKNSIDVAGLTELIQKKTNS